MSNLTRQEEIEQLINPHQIDEIQNYLLNVIEPLNLLSGLEFDNSLETIASVSLTVAENIYKSVKNSLELSEYSDDIIIQAVATAIAKMVNKEKIKHDSYSRSSLKGQFDYMEENNVPTDELYDAILNVLEERNQGAPGLK